MLILVGHHMASLLEKKLATLTKSQELLAAEYCMFVCVKMTGIRYCRWIFSVEMAVLIRRLQGATSADRKHMCPM